MKTPPNYKCVVIAGKAKTGTTLPLTLLDGHPNLLVMPEELHWFYLRCDNPDGEAAADRLFANRNIQMLARQNSYFDPKDYMDHGGTGFGVRDYSRFDFPQFEREVRMCFKQFKDPRHRFMGLIRSFKHAIGSALRDEELIFVCKAPGNENFSEKWNEMLGEWGRYIVCTRLSTEHYLSLTNIDKISNSRKTEVMDFVINTRKRFRKWKEFPKELTFVLGYDRLVNDSEKTMKEVCNFIGIPYDNALAQPTKMGVPWSGNSSRGIITEKVFKNEHKALELLSKDEIITIEYGLRDLYKMMDWQPTHQLTLSDMYRINAKIAVRENSPKELLVKFLKATLPKNVLQYLQDIEFKRDQKRRNQQATV